MSALSGSHQGLGISISNAKTQMACSCGRSGPLILLTCTSKGCQAQVCRFCARTDYGDLVLASTELRCILCVSCQTRSETDNVDLPSSDVEHRNVRYAACEGSAACSMWTVFRCNTWGCGKAICCEHQVSLQDRAPEFRDRHCKSCKEKKVGATGWS